MEKFREENNILREKLEMKVELKRENEIENKIDFYRNEEMGFLIE
jgi:hypothetical protein